MITPLSIYGILALAVCLLGYYILEFYYIKVLKLPPGPLSLPLFGNVLQLDKTILHLSLADMAKKYGDIFSIKFGRERVVILNKSEDVRTAYNGPDITNRPKIFSIDFFVPKGFLASHTDKNDFRIHTKMMKHAFRVITHSTLGGKLVDEAEDLIKQFTSYKGRPFDPREDIHLASLNVLYNMAFGKRYSRSEDEFKEIIDYSEEIMTGVSPVHPVNLIPWLQNIPNPWMKSLANARDRRDTQLMRLYQEHVDAYDSYSDKPTDMVEALLQAMRNAKVKGDEDMLRLLTPDHIVTNIWTIFFAGTDTVLTAQLWVFLYMAAFPDIQADIQAQIDQVVGHHRMPTLQDEKALSLLSATIYETIRYSSLSLLGVPHAATVDTKIGEYFIPKGTQVMANFWVMNHDESDWEKPYEFNPRRFIDDEGNLRNLSDFPFFMPFSTGQRACLGKNIGKSVIFMLTACLLQRLSFELPPGVKANLKPDIHFDLVPSAYKIVAQPRDIHTQEVFSKV